MKSAPARVKFCSSSLTFSHVRLSRSGTQSLEKTCEIIGRRALEKQRFSGQWMVEAENGGVQSLPAQRQERGSRGRLQQSRLGFEARAIDRIAEQWMAYVREMNPNLMRADPWNRYTRRNSRT